MPKRGITAQTAEPGSSASPAPASKPAPPTGRPRRRPWRRLALVILPVLVIGAFLYYWFFMRPYETTDDAFIEGNVTPIAPQVAGQIVRRLFRDNQAVKQGDLLLEIDPRDYEARLAQAQANLVAAQARLDQAKAQLAANEANVKETQASLVAAQSQAERTQTDLRRYQTVQAPAVSRSQFDLATAQARSDQAAVEVARSRITAAQAQVTLAKAAVATAAAVVQANHAAVRQAQLDLSYTKITAPTDGFMANRTVEVGAYVQVGQNLVALVPTNVWVTANFKETQLTYMHPGQPVSIRVDAFPNHTFRGHVDSIQRGTGARFSLLPPENATGNYVKVVQRVPVKIVFDEPPNPNLPLAPGMSVEPKVNILAKGQPGSGPANLSPQ